MVVLLVEDDHSLAELVIEYLEDESFECDHAFNGNHAIELILNNTYDVIILDINLPGANGLEVCETMRKAGLNTPCIMLTARNTLDDKVTGLNLGADDYLVKPFAMAELVARINALTKRNRHSDSLKIADLEIYLPEHYAKRGEHKIQPSPDEWKVLTYLASKSPQVVSRTELENILWPAGAPSTDALKMVIYRLRKMVDPKPLTPLIQTIRGVGVALKE
ncbi:response regulator transcription factor [Aliikangiella coralliicola]|uniref:Response regulator transcription factor n=1 Tax=Aliikangiella coralliicola TaxID=2592383 RepID=A0A545UCF2_9GAMM|nr:response regulator transcription factor [Aliikangiella coralliicola]TQV87148.1 response regulator transcription factor [Aliikangiella coralliicola]